MFSIKIEEWISFCWNYYLKLYFYKSEIFYYSHFTSKGLYVIIHINTITSLYDEGGDFLVLRFVDDLAGAIYDVFKFIIWSISYLLAGAIIVAIAMYSIVWIVGLFQ